jgi:NADP-dependent 3-hydroxy acid dehydrogenase YdfG
MMVKQKSGLIVTVSSAGGQTYLFTPAYGVGKVAVGVFIHRNLANVLNSRPELLTFLFLFSFLSI